MAQLIVLVLNEPNKLDQVLDAWLSTGVSGITILNSQGLAHHAGRRGARDDLPLFPSLQSLLKIREEPHRTLFAVVEDGFEITALVTVTEQITGSLDKPETGILFVIPLQQVWGLARATTHQ